jgi:hypothetical protein
MFGPAKPPLSPVVDRSYSADIYVANIDCPLQVWSGGLADAQKGWQCSVSEIIRREEGHSETWLKGQGVWPPAPNPTSLECTR